jgi:3-isopropylmalate/(R)-2-methylmalate dehydratase small subunit
MISQITDVRGRAVPLLGDDIDTDRIIPARYLRCVSFDGLGEHAFEDDRRQDPKHPFNQWQFQGATILLAGRNFGCGSSREHAPQALHKWGIRGIVAVSFAEIFFGNCTAMGIPCLTVPAAASQELLAAAEADPRAEFTLDVAAAAVSVGSRRLTGTLPAGVRQALTGGSWNATFVLLAAGDQLAATAARLPYLRNFAS